MRVAFKEWAVICQALDTGEQSLILRKGGISEEGGAFRPDHSRFWLFPTYLHQSPTGLKPSVHDSLNELHRENWRPETVLLTHYVEVPEVFRVASLEVALQLDRFHVWSEATVRQRFAYRTPGLFVLPVRVYRAQVPIEVPNLPEYDGCKTWVDLGTDLEIRGEPVLGNQAFAEFLIALHGIAGTA